MSSAHLTTGSKEPARVEGLLRLYSMKYCPYAQRPRLVLKAKGIPHDIVNINLFNKPDWYLKIHPEGKVPALLDGSKIIIESLDISDYLDEKYPENPLYPADPEAKRQDKELIQKIGPITALLFQILFQDKPPQEWVKDLGPLQVFENELAKRGTPYFGGEKPGMVDYMLWPWAERADIVSQKVGKKPPVAEEQNSHPCQWRKVMIDDQVPRLCKWKKLMFADPVCAEIYITPEEHWNVYQSRLNNTEPNYDTN